MVEQQIRQLRQIDDPARLEQILAQIAQQKAAAPPEFAGAIGIVEEWLRQRVQQLGEGAGDGDEGGQP